MRACVKLFQARGGGELQLSRYAVAPPPPLLLLLRGRKRRRERGTSRVAVSDGDARAQKVAFVGKRAQRCHAMPALTHPLSGGGEYERAFPDGEGEVRGGPRYFAAMSLPLSLHQGRTADGASERKSEERKDCVRARKNPRSSTQRLCPFISRPKGLGIEQSSWKRAGRMGRARACYDLPSSKLRSRGPGGGEGAWMMLSIYLLCYLA